MGSGEWGVGDEGDEGDEETRGITHAQYFDFAQYKCPMPNAQCPMPNAP
ncbi:histidine kinase [Nostoc sp. CHAB 5715]|nr:histidine kinase [Nostoc sp. CHAB 5715]MCC5622549.1 histidine kinase [Nostoc sp. CHAB 5715]